MRAWFARTNSWHWLCAAVAVSALVSAFLWKGQIDRVARERGPARERQAGHLAALRALSPDQPAALDRRAAAHKADLAALRREVEAAGFAPIPEGDGATLAVKNALDRALTARGLRILSSAISVAGEEVPRAAAKPAAQAAPRRVSADAYAREVQRAAANLQGAMKDDFLRDAQRKIAQLRAAEAREARRSAKRAAAAPSAPQAAPARLSFKTEEVAYTVEGEFRDMFLFLVGETFRKPSYHLKDIAVTRPEGGATRMTFTLQANHR